MKKFLLSSIFLFQFSYGVIACTEGLPTDSWEEPVVPVGSWRYYPAGFV